MNTAEQTNLTIMEPQARQLAPAAITPMQMLTQAVERGASVELMEKLMALHERWEANQARKAFDGAMAAAKAEIPVIAKTVPLTSPAERASAPTTSTKTSARLLAPSIPSSPSTAFPTASGPRPTSTNRCPSPASSRTATAQRREHAARAPRRERQQERHSVSGQHYYVLAALHAQSRARPRRFGR